MSSEKEAPANEVRLVLCLSAKDESSLPAIMALRQALPTVLSLDVTSLKITTRRAASALYTPKLTLSLSQPGMELLVSGQLYTALMAPVSSAPSLSSLQEYAQSLL